MIRHSAVLSVACMLSVSIGAGAPVYAQDVQTEILEKLRARADVVSATIVEDGLLSVLMEGEAEPRIVSPHQIELLRENLALPDEALNDFLASVTAPREALDVIPELSSARPVVRSKVTLDAFDQLLATWDEPTALIRYPVVADIEAAFAFQAHDQMRYVTEADLKTLKISKADFAEAAIRNFDAMTVETQWSQSGNALLAQLDGNYESSLILIDNLWPEIENALGGPIIVAVPARDSLIAVRADDQAQIDQLRRALTNRFAYPISPKLLTRRDGRWVEFD